jgi:transposase
LSTTIRLVCFEGPAGRRLSAINPGGAMETVFERVGALDVHKAQVTACVRVPGADGRREPDIVEFQTTVQGLMALHDWLSAHGVTHVAMEATGVYWQPVWHILEEDFELTLCNARHVKNVPGRKTDVSDAQWLCQLMEAGLLRGSFVPPKPQRRLRTLTRYRKTQIAERQREANRLHKALEDTAIKLDCVASDILGKSGRANARRLGRRDHRPSAPRRSRAGQATREDSGAAPSAGGPI